MSDSILNKNISAIQSVNPELTNDEIKRRLRSFRIEIIVDGTDSNTVNTSKILLNLLPRFFRSVKLSGKKNSLYHLPISHIELISQNKNNPSLIIYLGPKKLKSRKKVLFVGSCGWSAYISTSKPMKYPKSHQNPIGAILAGALAAGEAFKRAFPELKGELINELVYDPLTFGEKDPVIEPLIPNEIHFDDLTLIGLGGVGMGIIYCLNSLNSISGKLRLIDPEVMDKSNEQRYLYGFKENRGKSKVSIASDKLNETHPFLLDVKTHQNSYENIVKSLDMPLYLPTVIITVDQESTRKNVQAGLPKIIYNGWTDTDNPTMGYGIGKHELTGHYECLACAYFPKFGPKDSYDLAALRTGFSVSELKRRHENNILTTEEDIVNISKHMGTPVTNLERFVNEPITALLHGECGVLRVASQDKEATAPIPHIPLLLAIQIVTQLIIPYLEPSTEIKQLKSAAIFYGLKIPSQNPTEKRKKNPHCSCRDPVYSEAYKKKWEI